MANTVELSVPNICWPDGQAAHEEAINTLTTMDVPSIDIAPTKVWPKIAEQGADSVSQEDIDDFTRTLQGRKIAGFQSLTYGVPGKIFEGGKEDFAELSKRMEGVIDLAGRVGATTIIYGSPATRKLPVNKSQLWQTMRGHEFFGQLAERAFDRGVVLGIEPVSRMWVDPGFGQSGKDVYNFSNTFDDPDGHFTPPALVPDTFAMHDSGEDVWQTVWTAASNGRLAPHWQIAEKGMGQVGDETEIDHRQFAAALDDTATGDSRFLLTRAKDGHHMEFYQGQVTLAVEMFPSKTLSVTDSITRAVNFVRANYPVVQ